MKRYCEDCGKEVETKIVKKREGYSVCGETVQVEAQVLVCQDCGNELFSEELDAATLLAAYNEYRRRHRLLLPEEIRGIREQYGLSQRALAKLLNWGDKTIYRYENGSLQDKAHNSLLLFLREPHNMRTYVTENEVGLQGRQLARLLATVAQLERQAEGGPPDGEGEGCPATLSYAKFCGMVAFFAAKNRELLKTKLLKLLFYADMLFYKEQGRSLSGARYLHLPYGPVPENFDLLLGRMEAQHLLHLTVSYHKNYEKHRLVAEGGVPEELFSKAELAVLERVQEKFAAFGSREISAYSHREEGYRATGLGEPISYAYAATIELD